MRIIRTLIPLVLISLVIPEVAFGAPRTFKELVDFAVNIMNYLVLVMITAALVLYFYGISTNMRKFGDSGERVTIMKSYFLYGIAILFVMVSVWGILRVLQNTLFSGSGATNSVQTGAGGGF